MRILGLIPARGGSKGVPRKNIKVLADKPLIQYTIEAGLKSTSLDTVMVSTDDIEIASLSEKLGAKVPFLRPAELADDKSPTIDAVFDFLSRLDKQGDHYDAVCLLQATNPLRTSQIIEDCLQKFKADEADSLVSVRSVPHEFNPHWTYEVQNEKYLKIATGEQEIISRRQDLPLAFYRDGAVYISSRNLILEHRSLYGPRLSYFNCDGLPHVNIDTMEDWIKAENILCAE